MAQTHGSKEPILGSKVGASTQGTMCSWRGTMSGHYWHIFTAWTFATIPMLSLASAFVVALEASKPRSPPGSFYTDTQHNNRSLGLAFYSGIPSTQLTFIASFSSTLATALLPASMVLFSYTTALTMTRDSDKENHQHLPSPYQLELLISTLNGSLLTFWSFATYVLGRKGQRVTVISQLWRVTSLFGAMATLALLIAMTDAWLNFTVSTVQYFTHEPLPTDSPIYDSFAPSREISPGCLDLPPLGPYTTAAYYACIGLSTKNNSVDIVVSDPYGWLVVPKDVPSDIDFVATTIGSSTKCRAITPLCDLNHVNVLTNSSGPEGNPSSRYLGLSYECKRDKAGLDLVGNISATVNATTDSGFQIVEYTDSTMTTTSGDTDLRGPTLWYAAIVLTPVDEILICSTELSDVKYSYEAGMYTGTSWTAMNSTSSFAFVSAMTTASGLAVFQRGIQPIFATISSHEYVASEWASVYDQTMLNVGDGLLVIQDPVSVVRSLVTQVTRIPRAPLLTLIILDLLYALIGTCLAIAAIIAVRKGRSVRDAQARLSTLAVIAESFESPAWGEDAQNVDMLFAERRGEPTRRIALVKQADGEGRKYKQLFVPKDCMKRAPTVEEFLARKTRLGPGGSQV